MFSTSTVWLGLRKHRGGMQEPKARLASCRDVAAAEVGHHTNAGELRQQGGVLQLQV